MAATVITMALLLWAQRQPDRDRPLGGDYFPSRAQPEDQRDQGFYGGANYEVAFFAQGSLQRLYDYGSLWTLEGGYYWELREGMFASVGGFFNVTGSVSDTRDLGPPLGVEKLSVDFLSYGGIGRFGNGNWSGFHFGVSLGFGQVRLTQTASSPAGVTLSSSTRSSALVRAGVFLDREVIETEHVGIVLGITGDFYQTFIDDGAGNNIYYFTVGARLLVTLRSGIRTGKELPPIEDF